MPLLSDNLLVPSYGLLPSNHERRYLAEGLKGTEQTIRIMQELVTDGKRDIEVRKLVSDIIGGKIEGLPNCESKDYTCYVKAMYQFCRDKIKYLYDPHIVEYVETPRRILQTKVADCDSNCVLLASMLENAGFETQFVTIKADPDRRDEFSHVYLRVKIPRRGWYVADPTMPKKWFGWEPEGAWGKRYWPASTDELEFPIEMSDSIPVPPPVGMSGLEGRRSMYGFGALYNTYDDLNREWGKLDWDFRTGVATMPVTATSAFRPAYDAIIAELQRFAKTYLQQIKPTAAAPGMAVAALQSLQAKITDFKSKVSMASGQAVPVVQPPPYVGPGSSTSPGTTPTSPFVPGPGPATGTPPAASWLDQWKFPLLIAAGVAVGAIALGYWKPWKKKSAVAMNPRRKGKKR
jgi:hypothetical protein